MCSEKGPDRPDLKEIHPEIFGKLERDFGRIFDSSDNGEKRTEELMEKFNGILEPDVLDRSKVSEEQVQGIIEGLKGCSVADSREAFIGQALDAMAPIFELGRTQPEAFEEMRRKAFAKEGGFIPLNDILSYGHSDKTSVVHIHLAPAETMSFTEQKNAIVDGLHKLAELVRQNENVKIITATSWIVAKNPRLLEKFGFTFVGEIDAQMKEEHFANETRPVGLAEMTREELLAKY